MIFKTSCAVITKFLFVFSGSPFQFTVGPIAGGGAHKVHAAGLGLIRGEVNEPGMCLTELCSHER